MHNVMDLPADYLVYSADSSVIILSEHSGDTFVSAFLSHFKWSNAVLILYSLIRAILDKQFDHVVISARCSFMKWGPSTTLRCINVCTMFQQYICYLQRHGEIVMSDCPMHRAYSHGIIGSNIHIRSSSDECLQYS